MQHFKITKQCEFINQTQYFSKVSSFFFFNLFIQVQYYLWDFVASRKL